jgi:hypothetical protein
MHPSIVNINKYVINVMKLGIAHKIVLQNKNMHTVRIVNVFILDRKIMLVNATH